MARPKRKVADIEESSTPRRSQRNATRFSETHQEPEAKRRKTSTRACKEPTIKKPKWPPVRVLIKRKAKPLAVDGLAAIHPAAIFKTPKNPRATFEGLPAELRLRIYEILSYSTMIHVHRSRQDGKPVIDELDPTNGKIKFKWTPCRGTNPKNRLLCANPKWSGMCKEEYRCTYKVNDPPEPRGYWALAACNKAIRRETERPCLLYTVVSIHPDDIEPWIIHLMRHARKDFEQVRHVTIAGPDNFYLLYCSTIMMRGCLPKLQSVGVQCQSPFSSWTKQWKGFRWTIPRDAWGDWQTIHLCCLFDPSVAMAFEATVWQNKNGFRPWKLDMPEHMTTIRVSGPGTRGDHDEFTKKALNLMVRAVTTDCNPLGEPKRNAKWRAWWRTKETRDYSW